VKNNAISIFLRLNKRASGLEAEDRDCYQMMSMLVT
jgi:hypothetical protein